MSLTANSFFRRPLIRRLDKAARALLVPETGEAPDFTRPPGEPALVEPSSVSWRIFKNPVSLYIGGVTAVILELAEPRVRTGVWEHSGFRADPVRRLRRTGLAAMTTVYGARSVSEPMIGGIRRMHERVRGMTPAGAAYQANDPELLNWVHATAAFGFLQAYHAYVAPLSQTERDRYYCEGIYTAALYGARGSAASEAGIYALFGSMLPYLEPSPILFEFIEIMRRAPVLPPILKFLQPMLIRAAVSLTPVAIRRTLCLADELSLKAWERLALRKAGMIADRILLESSPPVQACLRLGLPADYLYREAKAIEPPDVGLRPKV